MMKMMMKPQKSQLVLAPNYRYDVTGTFDKSKFVMFGYENFEVFIAGAAGGRSGTANGRVMSGGGGSNVTSHVKSSGGGGGGFMRILGKKLSALTPISPVTVGVRGANGADSDNNVKASNGSVGGYSSFAGYIAYGGQGGVGGKYNITAGGNATCTTGRGGAGGGNSLNLGDVGTGGITASAEGSYPDVDATASQTSPTDGTVGFVIGAEAIIGGCGGGGGGGRVRLFDHNREAVLPGGQGAYLEGSPLYNCAGALSQSDPGFGGSGGGVNAKTALPQLGLDIRFGVGDPVPGAGINYSNGVVVIKVY